MDPSCTSEAHKTLCEQRCCNRSCIRCAPPGTAESRVIVARPEAPRAGRVYWLPRLRCASSPFICETSTD